MLTFFMLLTASAPSGFHVETINTAEIVPLPHAPGGSTAVQLRWTSSNGQVGTNLIDDGFAIALEVRAGPKGSDCTSRMAYFAAGTNTQLQKMTGQNLAQLLAMCPKISKRAKASALGEFRAKARQYRRAANLWRQQSRTAFGLSTSRCIALAPPPATCSRWSGKAN
jgi:hypothetical protein